MRRLVPILGLFILLAGSACMETRSKPISLFNGKDLAGWDYIAPGGLDIKAVCSVSSNGALAVAGKPNGYLATASAYENYRLHIEWRWPAQPGNGGVLVHISPGPVDRIWPTSFQIQTKTTRAGDLIPMAAAKFSEAPTPGLRPLQLSRSAADSEQPAGKWNTADIVCRDDAIEVAINGVVQNRATKCVPAAGKIGFQLEGAPFEVRNIHLTPLP